MSKNNDIQKTKKLIQIIQNYPFLYNASDILYHDNLKRLEAWKIIASELNTSVPIIKKKWKTLRDGYVKYKKCLKNANGKNKGYETWPWRNHLRFLNDRHSTPEIVKETSEANHGSSEKIPEKSLNEVSISAEENISIDFPSPDPSVMSLAPDYSLEGNFNESQQNSLSNSLVSMTRTECDGDKTKTELGQKLDGVDYLFMSYADSFKKLLPTTQAMLKFELASAFAKAEIKDLRVRCNISTGKGEKQSSN